MDTRNTSQSEYYKGRGGGGCLEVEESQGSFRPYDWEILCETLQPGRLQSTIHTYRRIFVASEPRTRTAEIYS